MGLWSLVTQKIPAQIIPQYQTHTVAELYPVQTRTPDGYAYIGKPIWYCLVQTKVQLGIPARTIRWY